METANERTRPANAQTHHERRSKAPMPGYRQGDLNRSQAILARLEIQKNEKNSRVEKKTPPPHFAHHVT